MEVHSKPRLAILCTMNATTLCSLIGREGASAALSNAALTNSVEAQTLFLMMSGPGAPRSAQGLGLHLVEDENILVKDTQRPVVHQHIEKLFKAADTASMAAGIKLFVFIFANQSEDQLIQKLRQVPDRIAGTSTDLIDGWCPQLWADLCCTYVMGEVSHCIAQGLHVPQALQTLCAEVVNARGKLSGAIRCYHKHIGGVSHASRDTWQRIEEVATQESSSSKFKISNETVEDWLINLRTARVEKKHDPIALLIALGELICGEPGIVVLEFAKWMVWASTNLESFEVEPVCRTGLSLRQELVECAAAVLKNAEYHTDVMTILSPATAEDTQTDGLVNPEDANQLP